MKSRRVKVKADVSPSAATTSLSVCSVAFEEGTSAAWLYDLLKPHVARVVVCNPRKTALLKHGNKNDRIDAGKLADLLRLDSLEPVYLGQSGVRTCGNWRAVISPSSKIFPE